MYKVIFILSLIVVLLSGCKKNDIVQASTDNPEWLKVKISTMSADQYYMGTKVFRYKWNGAYIYYIEIPVSSCAYCDVYDQSGNKISFTDNAIFQNFQTNRSDEVLIWEKKE